MASQVINGKGQVTSRTDAAGNVTRFVYDTDGNETEEIIELTVDVDIKTLKTYDDNGNVLTEIRQRVVIGRSEGCAVMARIRG